MFSSEQLQADEMEMVFRDPDDHIPKTFKVKIPFNALFLFTPFHRTNIFESHVCFAARLRLISVSYTLKESHTSTVLLQVELLQFLEPNARSFKEPVVQTWLITALRAASSEHYNWAKHINRKKSKM